MITAPRVITDQSGALIFTQRGQTVNLHRRDGTWMLGVRHDGIFVDICLNDEDARAIAAAIQAHLPAAPDESETAAPASLGGHRDGGMENLSGLAACSASEV